MKKAKLLGAWNFVKCRNDYGGFDSILYGFFDDDVIREFSHGQWYETKIPTEVEVVISKDKETAKDE